MLLKLKGSVIVEKCNSTVVNWGLGIGWTFAAAPIILYSIVLLFKS
jgi:hypothetical protein